MTGELDPKNPLDASVIRDEKRRQRNRQLDDFLYNALAPLTAGVFVISTTIFWGRIISKNWGFDFPGLITLPLFFLVLYGGVLIRNWGIYKAKEEIKIAVRREFHPLAEGRDWKDSQFLPWDRAANAIDAWWDKRNKRDPISARGNGR